MMSIDQDVKNNLHYSAAVTLSQKDVLKVKELILQNLNVINKVVSQSPEEVIYAMNFDFFDLGD